MYWRIAVDPNYSASKPNPITANDYNCKPQTTSPRGLWRDEQEPIGTTIHSIYLCIYVESCLFVRIVRWLSIMVIFSKGIMSKYRTFRSYKHNNKIQQSNYITIVLLDITQHYKSYPVPFY